MILEAAFNNGFLIILKLLYLWKFTKNIVKAMVLMFFVILPLFVIGYFIIAPDWLHAFNCLVYLHLVLILLLIN